MATFLHLSPFPRVFSYPVFPCRSSRSTHPLSRRPLVLTGVVELGLLPFDALRAAAGGRLPVLGGARSRAGGRRRRRCHRRLARFAEGVAARTRLARHRQLATAGRRDFRRPHSSWDRERAKRDGRDRGQEL